MTKEGFHPIRGILSIKLSEKKKKILQKKYQQTTSVNQERHFDNLKGSPLGEILKEKEEWVFIIERFAALEWRNLLLR